MDKLLPALFWNGKLVKAYLIVLSSFDTKKWKVKKTSVNTIAQALTSVDLILFCI
jgi:ribosomal protein S7